MRASISTAAGKKKVLGAAPGHAELVQQLVVRPLTSTQLKQLGQAAATIVHAIENGRK